MEQYDRRILSRLQRVMRAFVPREQDFFMLFRQASDKAVAAAEALDRLMSDYGRLELAVEQINDIEHEADEIVHEVVRKLNTTFVTPALFDREDIYRLAGRLDDIIDMTKGTVDRFKLFKIRQPTEHAQYMARLLLDSTRLLQQTIYGLHNAQPGENEFCAQINTLENEGDAALKTALADLFEHEPDAREIIKWKDIYEFVEEALDYCEDVANLIEAVITKNA